MVDWPKVRALMERINKLRNTAGLSKGELEQRRKQRYDLWQEAKELIEKG